HRVSLLREQWIPHARGPAAARRATYPPDPRGHRSGPLRRCLSNAYGVGSAPRLARGRLPPGCRCRPLRARARHYPRADRGHQPIRPPIVRSEPICRGGFLRTTAGPCRTKSDRERECGRRVQRIDEVGTYVTSWRQRARMLTTHVEHVARRLSTSI